MCYRGVWKDVLCCSGDFLAAWCLLQANSVGMLSSQLQQGGGGGGTVQRPLRPPQTSWINCVLWRAHRGSAGRRVLSLMCYVT